MTAVSALSLLQAGKKRASNAKTAKMEYRDGIHFILRFVSRAQLKKLSDDATTYRYNPKTRVREATMDQDRFVESFVKLAVAGWEGVTPRTLSRVAEVDLSDVPENQMDAPIPYDHDSMVMLFNDAYEVDNTIQEFVMDIKNFDPTLEDDLKNSKSSQGGS